MGLKVRLTRKLAETIDGVDLSCRRVGDVLDLTGRDAGLLLAHGWAVLLEARPAEAADRPWRPRKRPTIAVPLEGDEEPV